MKREKRKHEWAGQLSRASDPDQQPEQQAEPSGAASVIAFQRQIGNRGVRRMIQRRVLLAGPTDLHGQNLPAAWNDLDARQLRAMLRANRAEFVFNSRSRLGLAGRIAADMDASADDQRYSDEPELVSEVKKRMVTAVGMRISQGVMRGGHWVHAFGYPNRPPAPSTGPRVNEAALGYWSEVQDAGGDYYFNLSDRGRANAYQALMSLFTLQTDPTRRTLIHCDYLTSVLHMRAFAETIGTDEFNRRVSAGTIPLVLKWNGFTDIIAATGAAPTDSSSLQYVNVGRREDLIIGDHVVFHNHPMYDVLNSVAGGVWRLENAILVDRLQGVDMFQGHGYTTPVTEEHMKRSMMRHVHRHVGNALRLTRQIERARTPEARDRAEEALRAAFGDVVQRDGGTWYVRGEAFYGIRVDTPLRMPALDELPGLLDPRDPSQLFPVKRPIESR